jgi:aryl-alcohol dehydrogenase-like predicted oxidoreductase
MPGLIYAPLVERWFETLARQEGSDDPAIGPARAWHRSGAVQPARAGVHDRRGDPRYQGANFDANLKAAGVVRAVADEVGARPGQVVLAWLLHKGDVIVPIPGTKRRTCLEENIGADAVRLDGAQIARLDAAMVPEKVAGQRYPDWIMATIDR